MSSTRTVVVAPDGPQGEAVRERLMDWARAGTLREFMWLTPADWQRESSRDVPDWVRPVLVDGRVIGNEGARAGVGLMAWLGEAQPTLVRVIAAQLLHERAATDLELVACASELQRRLGPALVTEGSPDQPEATRSGARTVAVNLLVPATGVSGVPRDVLLKGAWATVVASPEDRLSPRRTSNIVVRSEHYAAHAALEVASIGGLWAALSDDGPFDEGALSPSGASTVVAGRPFSRILHADEVVYQVADGILKQSEGEEWSLPVKSHDRVVTPDPDGIVDRAITEAEAYEDGLLKLRLPEEERFPKPPKVGIWASIAAWAGRLWQTTLSVPAMIKRRLALLAGQLTTLFLFGSRHQARIATPDAAGYVGTPSGAGQADSAARRPPAIDSFVMIPGTPGPVRPASAAGGPGGGDEQAFGAEQDEGPDPDYEDVALVKDRRSVEKLVQRAERELLEPPAMVRDVPVPQLWQMLQSVSFGLLDGGDLPSGLTQPRQGAVHEVLAAPARVSPRPEDRFALSPESVEQLDLGPGDRVPEVRSCDPSAARLFGQWLEAAAAAEKQAAIEQEDATSDPSDGPFELDRQRFADWTRGRSRSALWRLASNVVDSAESGSARFTRSLNVLREDREDRFAGADKARRRFVDGWMALLCGLPAFLAAALLGFDVVAIEGAGWIASASWILWFPLGGSLRRLPDDGTGGGRFGRGSGRWFLGFRLFLAIAYLTVMTLVGYQVVGLTWAQWAFGITLGWFTLYVFTRLRKYWFIPAIVLLAVAIAFLPLYRLGVDAVRSPLWWVIVAVVLWLSAWIAAYADYSREMFQFQTWRRRLDIEIGNEVRAGHKARLEIRRLHGVYRQLVDWCEIIGWVLHEPYAPLETAGTAGASGGARGESEPADDAVEADSPSPAESQTLQDSGVAAFQVQHVAVSDEGFDEVLDRAMRALRPRRWLSSAYARCAEPFSDPDAVGSGRSPEADISPTHGARTRLLEALTEGSARRQLTDWALARIERVVEDADPDRLLTVVPGEHLDSPTDYLTELEPTTPYLVVDSSLWTDSGKVHKENRLERIEVWAPQQLASRATEEGDGTTTVRHRFSRIRVHAGIGYAVQVARYDVTGPSAADEMALFALPERPEPAVSDWDAESTWY